MLTPTVDEADELDAASEASEAGVGQGYLVLVIFQSGELRTTCRFADFVSHEIASTLCMQLSPLGTSRRWPSRPLTRTLPFLKQFVIKNVALCMLADG